MRFAEFKQVVVDGRVLAGAIITEYSIETDPDVAQQLTMAGASLLQVVNVQASGRPRRRAVDIVNVTLDFARFEDMIAARSALALPVVDICIGEASTDRFEVMDASTSWQLARRLPTGIPGVEAARWIQARIDGVLAELITAGVPGPGQVKIPTALQAGSSSIVETEDLMAAGASSLVVTYAPVRRATVRIGRQVAQFNEYPLALEIVEAAG